MIATERTGDQRGRLGRLQQGALLILVLLLPAMSGCPLLWFALSPGDCGLILTIQGQLLDADGTTPVSGAIVGGRIFFENGGTDYVPLTCGGEPCSSMDDGMFAIEFVDLGPCPPGSYPTPDRIEIVVRRDTCETTYAIDVNDDTVDDLGTTDKDEGAASNHTIELREAILVPACEGDAAP